MFFDCTALLAGLIASVISRWKKNETFSYGYCISYFYLYSFLCVLYAFVPFVPFTLCWVTLCIWFSTWLQNIESIFWKHPIHSYAKHLIGSSPWFQTHSNKKCALKTFKPLKWDLQVSFSCKFSVPFTEPNDICGLGNFSYTKPDGKGNLLSLAPKCVHMSQNIQGAFHV